MEDGILNISEMNLSICLPMITFVNYLGCALGILFVFGSQCSSSSVPAFSENSMTSVETVDHSLFDELLQNYVTDAGLVDYASIKEQKALNPYLDVLSAVNPGDLSEAEAIAYWINAYNAYTIKLIIDNYPVGSIREISPLRIKGLRLAIPKINSPFEYELAKINGESYSLDDIEHGILRKQYNEPRIHFALVCAAISCPTLRREAYSSDRLNEQLDDQARTFLFDETKNRISGDTIYLSRIFDWFQKDFAESKKDLQVYLSAYFDGELQGRLRAGDFKIKYLKYDWALNETSGV